MSVAGLPKLLTLREAAKVLRMAPKTLVNGWSRRAGPWADLPRTRVGGKVLIPVDAVRAKLAAGEGLPQRRPQRTAPVGGSPAAKGRQERREV